uniref:YLPM1-like spectrin repeat domain-containing protein n=1 Tax=Phlebotomus papatasi TaxID=29031 RepID=A0A1B0D1J9_PHLPP
MNQNQGNQNPQNQRNQFNQGRNQRNPRQNQQMNKFQGPGPMNQQNNQFNQRQQNFGQNQQQWNQQQNWGQQNRQQGNNWNRNQGPPPLMGQSWGNPDNSFEGGHQDEYQEEEYYEDYPEGEYSHYEEEYNEEEEFTQQQQQQQQQKQETPQKPQKAPDERFYEDNFDEVPQTSSQVDAAGPSTKIPPPESTSTKEDTPPKKEAEKDEDELRFDEQFKKWEEQFLNWKKQNQNHPDRRAYREYEMKFEECRKNLLERREQMRRRKMQEKLQAIRAEESAQEDAQAKDVEKKAEDVPKDVVQEEKTTPEESQAAAPVESEPLPQKQLENLTNLFNANSGSIPGLDLVTHEEKAGQEEARESSETVNLLAGTLGELNRGANLAEISRNISSLLKTPNLMDILSLVKGTSKEQSTVEHAPLEKPNLDPWVDMNDPWADIGAGRSQERQEERYLERNFDDRRIPEDFGHEHRRFPEQFGMGDRGRMYDDYSAARRYPDRGISRMDEDSMSQQSGNWMRNYGDRMNDFDNSRSSFSNVNYDDSGDIFRPTQVIDYQNMSRDRASVDPLKDPLAKKWPEDDILRPAKVVDYGHKKVDAAPAEVPVITTIDYGHGTALAKKKKPEVLRHHLSKKQMKRIDVEAIIEAAKKRRKARIEKMKVIEQSNPDYPKKGWILIGEKPTFPTFPTKRGLRKTRSGRIQLPKAERRRRAEEAIKLQYEGISDSEDDDVQEIGGLPSEVVQISDDDMDDLNESLPDVDDNPDNQMSDTSLPDAEEFDFPSADKFLSEKSAKRKAEEESKANEEKRRREEDIFPEIEEKKSKEEDIFPEVERKKKKEEDIFSEEEETGFHVNIGDILDHPHRKLRPKRIIMIMRGPPGSGKTHFAKLIKDREVENGGSAPRILSIDDYYMTEEEEMVRCPETNKMIEMKKMVYTYEEGMEEQYTQYLLKSFRKTITDGYFDFIIVDFNNKELAPHQEIVNFGRTNGFT